MNPFGWLIDWLIKLECKILGKFSIFHFSFSIFHFDESILMMEFFLISLQNLQSTNWQTMRFKPPPPHSPIGWRVEFRPMEVCVLCSFFLLTQRKWKYDSKGTKIWHHTRQSLRVATGAFPWRVGGAKILLTVFYSMRVLPIRLAIVAT